MNLAIALAQILAWAGTLTALSIVQNWPVRILLIVFFALMMQGVFSLMHEAIHGQGHPDRRLNQAIGLITGVLFGTAYTLFRVNHEGHHVRNRTPSELSEFILPGEVAWKKVVLYYFAVLGGIWLGSVIASLFIPWLPYSARHRLARPRQSMDGYALSFAQFSPSDWTAFRLDSLCLWLFWGGIVSFGPWPVWQLMMAYAAFGFSWSSLQWVYHLRTPLHPIEGAYDLRAPAPIRWLMLNFCYNLSHHRQPRRPWQELPSISRPGETQPLWYRYLGIFRPPVALPQDLRVLEKRYF